MFKKNKFQYINLVFIWGLTFSTILSCTTDSEKDELLLKGKWNQEALVETEINRINIDGSSSFFSTSDGVFLKSDKIFLEFGLKGKNVNDLVKIGDGIFLAGISLNDFSYGDTTLFKTHDNGSTWTPHSSNYGGENKQYTIVDALEIDKNDRNNIFARASNNIALSVDGGVNWTSVFGGWDSWGGKGLLIYFSPNDENTIWAGGVNGLSEPYLIKSSDYGKTWASFEGIKDNIESVCYDMLENEINPTEIIVGMSGNFSEARRIKKSTDHGETWETVFKDVGIYTFAKSTRTPEIIYASGINSQGRLFFTASGDFGDTWETVEFEESPSQMYVNDMVSVMEDGQEVLYLGTNKGVYSYTFEE